MLEHLGVAALVEEVLVGEGRVGAIEEWILHVATMLVGDHPHPVRRPRRIILIIHIIMHPEDVLRT